MMKLKKYNGFLLLLILFNTAFSQEKMVLEKFAAYNRKALFEKLYVHTDKDVYVAGEILWFKLYYVNGDTGQTLDLSKVAYVELLQGGKSVLQAKISLEAGECSGSFYLPVSLNSGYYTLKAYTRWMKNFDKSYFFQKEITIVNTIKSPGSVPGDSTIAPVKVSFFPEGGSLVNGIQSKIGFTVTGNRGGVNDCYGFIIDQKGDTITSFRPLQFGIGNFEIIPREGYSYRAVIVLADGSFVNKELPIAYNYGYVMKVREEREELVVTVKRKKMPGEQHIASVLLTVHKRQLLKAAEKAFISDGDSVSFRISTIKAGSGVIFFTVFDDNNKPLCERLFFIKPVSALSLLVESDKKTYAGREKVSLALRTAGIPGSRSDLDLSVSVFYEDALQEAMPRQDIVSYMRLASDMTGSIESPGYYFSDNDGVKAAADNLMLTHGWRRFNWESIWKDNSSFIKYVPEINGQLVTGKVTDIRTGQSLEGVIAYLSVPGNPFGFYSGISDSAGIVTFDVKNYFGNGKVIVQRGIGVDSFVVVTLLQPFALPDTLHVAGAYQPSEDIKEELLQRSIGMQVQNYYSADSLLIFKAPLLHDTLPFYGLPEASYRLDDYKRFQTMEEVLREYVREIGVGLRGGQLIFKIYNPEAHDFYDNFQLVLLDGVVLSDVNTIFSYDPLKIRKLDIIQSRYGLGPSVFNGVASFTTYSGAFDGYELDPKLLAIDYPGLQLQREFYSPVYETREQIESRIPDFRSTLYWNPAVTAAPSGISSLHFYSSDRKGKYVVLVEGMNRQGDFVVGQTSFEIK